MMALKVSTPKIDLSQGFKKYWYGDNRAVTLAFNAFSFMFPLGEKYFIDIAREVAKQTDLTLYPKLEAEVKVFVKQEMMHTKYHEIYNHTLEKQGFINVADPIILRLDKYSKKHLSSLTNLGIVCAYEHFTAVLGDFILSDTTILEPAEKELALIWGWHAVEETEHKAVCFDLYEASGGGWLRRILTFLMVSFNFQILFLRTYLSLLYRDGALHPKRLGRTLSEMLPFFFGRKGFVWPVLYHSLKYLSVGFHPWKDNNSQKALKWIEDHKEHLL